MGTVCMKAERSLFLLKSVSVSAIELHCKKNVVKMTVIHWQLSGHRFHRFFNVDLSPLI